jgi:hypothetical protein
MATTKKTRKSKTSSKKVTAKKTTAQKAGVTTASTVAAQPVGAGVKATKTKNGTVAGLALWNKLMALLFAAQAVAVAWLGNATSSAVTTQYVTVDPLATEAAGQQVLATASRHMFDLRISWVVAAGLAVLALSHLALATIYRKRYEAEITSGVSKARWLTIGLAGAVMMLAVAGLSGVHSEALLAFMAGSVLLGAGLADATLRMKQSADAKRPLSHAMCVVATVVSLAPWAVLACNLWGVWRYDGALPTYLYAVYGSMFLLTLVTIVAVRWRMQRRGRWADSVYNERSLMVLGFVTASLLAWQIFAGVLYP